ncbi:MAG: phosphate ABC transporter permease subunit PstC [Tannerella sp.]|nr:phosphate ABC transporter permease subunit PstC [Tannerella sp.]
MKHIIEKTVESMLTLSGAVTTVTILLIVIFLFREAFGLFKNPAVEKGYALCINASNPVTQLNAFDIKQIFDYQIENWSDVGGNDEVITVFRFEEIFSLYDEAAFGNAYEFLPDMLGEVIATAPDIIAFLPEEYIPHNNDRVRILRSSKITVNDFFGGKEWMPTATPAPRFGILPLILGTLWVSLAAILIALPLGLGVAVYLSELAGIRMRKILKPAIELLAGIPSVVYGFFGLAVLVPLVQQVFDISVGETGFTGSIILAIMALPTIITVAEDALRNTPAAVKEASLALGATHWQTIYKVIIPYASSGISAAVILGTGRAVGETMAVLMVTGNAAVMPESFFEPLRTIPATIAAELGEAPAGGAHYQSLFMLGCILFLLTLVISITAGTISKRHTPEGI